MPIHVEIWSDFVCPFCYIGKRNFEAALAQFPGRSDVRVTWKSFELDPAATNEGKRDLHSRLAEKYGQDIEWARGLTAHVTETALAVDLHFRLDHAIHANTFNAHRLMHLAAKHGLADAAEERFMAAHFSETKDLGDTPTLLTLAAEIGLPADEATRVLAGDEFSADVRHDEREAANGNIHSVPYYVFNRKTSVRGAQPVEAFLSALHQASEG